MKGRVAAIGCLLAGAVGLLGCSLVKLSEDIVQGTCQDDADCAELNDEGAPDFDPCKRWQCNTKEKLCRYGALDADGDEQTPASVLHAGKRVKCERDAQQQDCDDTREQVGNGFPELCDERDNDCDGRADEAVLESERTRAVLFDGAGDGSAATDASYARDPLSGEIAIAYGLLRGANSLPGASLLDAELATSGDAASLEVETLSSPLTREVAIAPLEGGRFAYALVTTSGMQRILAGVWSPSANQIRMDAELAHLGVQCMTDYTCRALFAPAIASLDRHVLLAYLHLDTYNNDRSCEAQDEVDPPARVMFNLMLRPSERGAEEHLRQQGLGARGAGMTRDLSPPALLSLPAIGGLPASWLVAHADVDGTVVVAHVERRGSDALNVVEALARVDGGGARLSAVALALGPADDEGQLVGIAYQRGCGSDARVEFDVRRLRDDGGKLAVDAVASAIAVGGSSNETQPALAYSAERDAWLVAYRDLNGLRARAVASDGALHGSEPYTLIARVKPADGDEVDVLPLRPAVFDVGDRFAAVAHVLRAGEEDPRAFEAVQLGCGLQ